GNITIPQAVLLATEKDEATFETRQPRTLQEGQVRIDVPVRATDEFRGEAGIVEAGAISQVSQPIAGINRVTNFDATFLGAEDESDDELRLRAKAALRALGKGTLAALSRVIFEERAKLVETFDPNGPEGKRADPGQVTLLVETEPERFPSLQAAVEETRAAGVQATLVARYVFFKPRIIAQINAGITPAGKDKITGQIIESLQAYVDGLGSGDPAVGEALLNAITAVDDVSEARIVDVIAWVSDIGQPGAEGLVDAILASLETAQPGDEARRAAIAAAVLAEGPSPPTGRRIPKRDQVQGESGARATDEEIEAGTFKVAAEVGGEAGWVVLDVEPADIALTEEAG
ncbi:MAG: baseplate J/gp47 family protein, partial [Chloroflexota bacterium]